MTESDLIKKLASSVGRVPAQANVLAVRPYSTDDLERRGKQFMASLNEAYNLSLDKGDWTVKRERTLIRLPRGATAVIYHASGAMKFTSGLAPMENLFATVETDDALVKLVEAATQRLKLTAWASADQTMKFERLWKIKAAAGDRTGKVTQPVLCRVIGAYRQFVGELPVLGPASASMKLAANGVIDGVLLQLRETTPEVIERPAIVPAEEAARQLVTQLSALMGRGKVPYTEVVVPESMRLGYLNLGKRQAQQVLAPVYLATVSMRGEDAQAYVLVTSATEKPYLPIARVGHEAPLAAISRQPATAPVRV